MSRIRCTKPEFWSSEQVMNLSIQARLCFIGLWNFCDDAGIHSASALTLKAEVFPCDEIDVAPLMQEMVKQGLVMEYEVNCKSYWHVTGWHHQRIDRPTFKHPLPDGNNPNSYKEARRVFGEYSTIDSRAVGDTSPPEGKGKDMEGSR